MGNIFIKLRLSEEADKQIKESENQISHYEALENILSLVLCA